MGRTRRENKCSFHGCCEATILDDSRIRLPSEVMEQLAGRPIRIAMLPGRKALVICLEASWDKWQESKRRFFKELNISEDASRAFLSSSFTVNSYSDGRIYIKPVLREHAGLLPGVTAVILGSTGHFEVWLKPTYLEMIAKCDKVILGTQPSEA